MNPTRLTETSATIIDNILTNCDDEITTAILVTDISDHFPTILINKARKATKHVNTKKNLNNENGFVYKRKHTDDKGPFIISTGGAGRIWGWVMTF